MQVLKLKAGKADIWRLAIIERYGGIYVDSDVKARDSDPVVRTLDSPLFVAGHIS